MEFWYLYHSAFAVRTQQHFLIFDYYHDSPRGGKLADGVIDPEEVAALAQGRRIVAFASHSHGDHYTRDIFRWRQELPEMLYILSDDIHTREEAAFMAPHQTRSFEGGLTVSTLGSTDKGVAFLVQVDGRTIFHAGDLNWWDWSGESDDYRSQMEADYRAEIARLKGEKIDLAFIPVDPRLEENYLKGLHHFMEEVGAAAAVPMHFAHDLEVSTRMLADPQTEGYREKLIPIHRRGEHFRL